jgi:hypothetical protein
VATHTIARFGGRGAWLGSVVISLAERTAGSSARQPRVEATGVEGVAAAQTANVVVVLEAVDADSTGVSGGAHTLRREGGVDVFVVVLIVVVVR